MRHRGRNWKYTLAAAAAALAVTANAAQAAEPGSAESNPLVASFKVARYMVPESPAMVSRDGNGLAKHVIESARARAGTRIDSVLHSHKTSGIVYSRDPTGESQQPPGDWLTDGVAGVDGGWLSFLQSSQGLPDQPITTLLKSEGGGDANDFEGRITYDVISRSKNELRVAYSVLTSVGGGRNEVAGTAVMRPGDVLMTARGPAIDVLSYDARGFKRALPIYVIEFRSVEPALTETSTGAST